jgi:hypothetical protein
VLWCPLLFPGTDYPSRAAEFTPGFKWDSCYSIFSFLCMFCRSLFVLLIFFPFAILLSVLVRLTDSDSPFGIVKLFLRRFVSTPIYCVGGSCFNYIIYIYLCILLSNTFVILDDVRVVYQLHDGCDMRSRNCQPFQSTRFQSLFLFVSCSSILSFLCNDL